MTAALEGGEWSASRPGRTLPSGKIRYPFYRRLGGPQGRSGRAENLVPTGIWSRTVVSRYTDWATRSTSLFLGQLKRRQYDTNLKLITNTYCTFVTNFIINVTLFDIIQHKTGMRTGSDKLSLHILKRIIHNLSACFLCQPTCYSFWRNSLRTGSELGRESQYSTQQSFSSWHIQHLLEISLTNCCWSPLGTTAVVATEFDSLKQAVHKQWTSGSVQDK